MKQLPHSRPILSCEQARSLEAQLLEDEASEWAAVQKAGFGIAHGLIRDYPELRPMPDHLRILALIGKGHNGADALVACGELLAQFPRARVDLVLTAETGALKPITARALQELEGRVHLHSYSDRTADSAYALIEGIASGGIIHICIDGLVGANCRPPLQPVLLSLVEAVNQFSRIDLRAAVDLPSGIGDDSDKASFRPDFTYATGVAKKPLFAGIAPCGRVRYVDLGFFQSEQGQSIEEAEQILCPSVLKSLNRFRQPDVDKRSFGHLFIVGGSAYMPGALLMAVEAAVRSSVGLVTAFAPQSVASALAAQLPEAMWVPWPETSNGTLNPRALPLLFDRIDSASAILVGPGLGRDRYTELLAQEVVKGVEVPVILDADALRARVVEVATKRKPEMGRVVITPHMGEFMRVAKIAEADYSPSTLIGFSQTYRVMTVLKTAMTRICDGEGILYNTTGGPVLSRGGSGDLLAGLIGGMVAQDSSCMQTAVARGLMLHGMAAQRLARDKGQAMVRTTQLLDYLPDVMRELGVYGESQ